MEINSDSINIFFNSTDTIYLNSDKIYKLQWEIKEYFDINKSSHYFIKVVLEGNNNQYCYEYNSSFMLF